MAWVAWQKFIFLKYFDFFNDFLYIFNNFDMIVLKIFFLKHISLIYFQIKKYFLKIKLPLSPYKHHPSIFRVQVFCSIFIFDRSCKKQIIININVVNVMGLIKTCGNMKCMVFCVMWNAWCFLSCVDNYFSAHSFLIKKYTRGDVYHTLADYLFMIKGAFNNASGSVFLKYLLIKISN